MSRPTRADLGRWIGRSLAIVIFAGLALFVFAGMFLPGRLEVKAARRVSQPMEKVFANLADLRNWQAWLPWAEEDPGMALSYQGAAEGVGMNMSWDSQRHGEGRITISAAQPDESLRAAVEFHRKGTCVAEFSLSPAPGNTTEVRLRFLAEYGQNYAGRYLGWLSEGYAQQKLKECLENLDASMAKAAERELLRQKQAAERAASASQPPAKQ